MLLDQIAVVAAVLGGGRLESGFEAPGKTELVAEAQPGADLLDGKPLLSRGIYFQKFQSRP